MCEFIKCIKFLRSATIYYIASTNLKDYKRNIKDYKDYKEAIKYYVGFNLVN